ncbi:unnamed protein product [Auanema sp. JU1783]|nr:unnamed protein product [Auanema sp. JU1783]
MSSKRVAIIGYGHLGKFLATKLSENESFEVVRIFNRTGGDNVLSLEEISFETLKDVDLVVEVAHPAIISKYAPILLEHCDLFIGSPTCLANAEVLSKVEELAKQYKRRVLIPSGAFWGANDIQKMADLGTLKGLSVTMIKHPSSFKLESPLKEINEKAKENATEPTVLYEGSVRGLCPLAPNNVNTMAGAAIAAKNLGFDGVTARLVSDPNMRDWHIVEVVVQADDGFEVKTIRKNPAKPGAVTGQFTYFSFLASIKESLFKPIGLQIC